MNRAALKETLKKIARRSAPIAINLALVAVSLGIAGLLAELGVRVLAPQQLILIRPDLWEPADTVGWLHRPNVDIKVNTGERSVSVFTDSAGFRVGAAGRVDADHKVLLLGDSFMEALQVEYEQSTSGLLQSTLPKLVGEPVAVRDAGIGGWDPDQYFLRARTLLAQDRYDLVVTALYPGNDPIARARDYLPPRQPVERYHLRLPHHLSRREFTDAILRPINDFLEVRSQLFIFFRNRLQTLRMKAGLAPLTFPVQFLTSEATSDRWAVTADLCAQIDSVAEAHGARALFVMIPAALQVDSTALMHYVEGYDLDPSAIDLEQPNRLLGGALEARGLTLYDPLDAFRTRAKGRQLYGAVDPHFNPEGNRLFADLVAPVIATELKAALATGERPQ